MEYNLNDLRRYSVRTVLALVKCPHARTFTYVLEWQA